MQIQTTIKITIQLPSLFLQEYPTMLDAGVVPTITINILIIIMTWYNVKVKHSPQFLFLISLNSQMP